MNALPLQSSGIVALEIRGLPSHHAEVPQRGFDIFPRCGDLPIASCAFRSALVGRFVLRSIRRISPEKVGNARRSNLGG
jgi:hypothetical protein